MNQWIHRRDEMSGARGCGVTSSTSNSGLLLEDRRGSNPDRDDFKIAETREVRAAVGEPWRDLRGATRRIGPDRDLGARGLRASWEAGDRARSYPGHDNLPRRTEAKAS
jgi:hypothetical protein